MCANCLSTGEVIATQIGFAIWVTKDPIHRALAKAGLAPELDLVKRDRHTVGFLRSLDLDPVELLGAGTVEAADAWTPTPTTAPRLVSIRDAVRACLTGRPALAPAP